MKREKTSLLFKGLAPLLIGLACSNGGSGNQGAGGHGGGAAVGGAGGASAGGAGGRSAGAGGENAGGAGGRSAGGAGGESAGGAGGDSAGGAGGGNAGGAGGGAAACVLDQGAADWFAGVWSGVQQGETFTVTNRGGCSRWEGTISGALCDRCTGTYTLGAASTATLMLSCVPAGKCSLSPIHMDTGTVTFSGCNFVYDYQFSGTSGTGSATFTSPNRIGDAPADVCGLINGSAD